MPQLTNAGASRVVVVGGASARNGVALDAGQRYLVVASTNCHCKQGGSVVTVAAGDAGSFFLAAGSGVLIDCDGVGSDYVAVIQASSGGQLYITHVEGGRE